MREIPVVDCRNEEWPAAEACRALPAQMAELMVGARRTYTAVGLRLADRVSRRWLERNRTPYLGEIEAVAKFVGQPGIHALNASFEWACTTGVAPAGSGGMAMVRVLDWVMDGMGRNLAVIRQSGPASEWRNLGWPGYAGCITGIAPGRFAAAINWLPRPGCRLGTAARALGMTLPGLAADWLADRPATWRSDAMPPAHLLRQVMDTAGDYEEALRMLQSGAIAAPAVFTIAGTLAGQGAVVERTRDGAAVRGADPAVAAANHWMAMPVDAEPNYFNSQARQAAMQRQIATVVGGGRPDLLGAPVINRMTRLVALMDAATGSFILQGFERDGPATAPLVLDSSTAA